MKEFARVSAGQVVSKYGESAPMAAVCCNACRTCISTNAVGIAMAATTGAALAVWGLARKLARRPPAAA